ncbi:MAG: aspartate--tRNA ligase, partial [Maribacter sp.]
MYRSHSCGELRESHIGTTVTLSGWVAKTRDKGFVVWVDVRDRYGITQLVFDEDRTSATLLDQARNLGREYVIQIRGEVIERASKNEHIPTGNIEVLVTELTILNESKTPPFTIENETDGGEDLRMKYRYLDIRRNPVKNNLIFRSKVAMEVRKFLSADGFIEIETPYLIKSTPEGARDFVVPSRMNAGQFYALPQSPQTFKQLLMVGGMDKYFQIVKCFRDEDLRADRQPEFTQIDCEMAFVEQEDILTVFEGLTKHLLKEIKGIEVERFPRMTYDEAMARYGNDKPDIRFGMEFRPLAPKGETYGFGVFDDAESVIAINVEGCASYTRKQIDELVDWVKRPQIGATGLIWIKVNEDGSHSSSVNKFFDEAYLAHFTAL